MFDYAGRTHTRRGFMARVRLQRFGEGNIYPHEETMSGPEAGSSAADARLQDEPQPDLWPVSRRDQRGAGTARGGRRGPAARGDRSPGRDPSHVAGDRCRRDRAVAAAISPKPVFIADGHHRYETACNYRDELSAAGPLRDDHPANFVLMMCVGMEDPGMVVLPTHRLFRGLPAMKSARADRRSSATPSPRAWPAKGPTWPTPCGKKSRPRTIRERSAYTPPPTTAGYSPDHRRRPSQMAKIAAEHSQPWRDLGVSILHRLVIDTLLAGKDLPKPRYVHLVEEVIEGLETGEFPLAALVMPATVGDIQTISKHQRTDAGQEHLFLSEAAQRAGAESAGVAAGQRLSRMSRAVPRETRQICCGRGHCSAARVSRETRYETERRVRVSRETSQHWRLRRFTWHALSAQAPSMPAFKSRVATSSVGRSRLESPARVMPPACAQSA